MRFWDILLRKSRSGGLKPRVAQRRSTDASGLYKVLDRDRFYARHYEGAKNTMTLIDVSTTGCAFKTDLEIVRGSYVELEFKKLSEKHIFDTPIIIACETIYCLPLKEAANRIGAKFLEIERKDIEKIKNFSEPLT